MHRGNSLTPFSKWLQSVELGAATTHLIKVPPAFEIAFFFFFLNFRRDWVELCLLRGLIVCIFLF